MRGVLIMLKRLGTTVLDVLFPRRCVFCSAILKDKSREVCALCEMKLPYTGSVNCEQHFDYLNCCYSPLYYRGNVRESLLRFKFRGLHTYSKTYAKFIAKCIDECEVSCDIISWVPVSPLRKHLRGYDQARLLAEELAKLRGTECVRVLRKIRHNRAQSSIQDAAKRKRNASGVYRCIAPELVRGKCILLVDDIVTTGSTLSSAAAVLKETGAASVEAVTVARAVKNTKKIQTDKKEHSFSLY